MKPRERGLICSAAEVRGFQSGAKTQIRVPMREQPMPLVSKMHDLSKIDGGKVAFKPIWLLGKFDGGIGSPGHQAAIAEWRRQSDQGNHCFVPPYQPGMRLYVRETWRLAGRLATEYLVEYQAGGERTVDVGFEGPSPAMDAMIHQDKWRSSATMPRFASRLTLEVKAVRAERLHELHHNEAALEAEGIELRRDELYPHVNRASKLETVFVKAWDARHGKRYPWASNGWVWVLSVGRVEAGG